MRRMNKQNPVVSAGLRQHRQGVSILSVVLTLIVGLMIGVVVLAFFLPAVRRGVEAPRRGACRNNLKQIMLALANYSDDYECLPPPYTVDETGQPLHSWRTLILPYMDQQPLYETIDLTKPWNDPANAGAFATRIPAYQCPSAGAEVTSTTYMGIVGPDAFFHLEQTRQFHDFTDGTPNTIGIIEVPAPNAVHWMAPVDTDTKFLLNINEESALSHNGGFHVVLVDGKVTFLSQSLSQETLQSLTTISAGDPVSEF